MAPCSQPTLGCVFLVSWQRPESCRSPGILWRSLLRLVSTPNITPLYNNLGLNFVVLVINDNSGLTTAASAVREHGDVATMTRN